MNMKIYKNGKLQWVDVHLTGANHSIALLTPSIEKVANEKLKSKGKLECTIVQR